MNSQTAKLVHRSIIRYLNDEKPKGEILASKATESVKIEKYLCHRCYLKMVKARWRITKRESMHIYLCTKCGGMNSMDEVRAV